MMQKIIKNLFPNIYIYNHMKSKNIYNKGLPRRSLGSRLVLF